MLRPNDIADKETNDVIAEFLKGMTTIQEQSEMRPIEASVIAITFMGRMIKDIQEEFEPDTEFKEFFGTRFHKIAKGLPQNDER